ncbi:amidohydrolase family protein [Ravibacter arvi]|uniref:Amidohydrolase family protein n=1 Tax=Ravibacter arvi TaxID=2051041 RepID=A0ABP8M676_9BACT
MYRYLLLLLLLSPVVSAQELVTGKNREIAFVAVNVIPMDKNEVVKNQTVIVKNGRIIEMGPSGKVKPGSQATIIDGKGKYLLPGWAEMHAHVPQVDNFGPMKEVLMLYLVNGITQIRGMLGAPSHLELRNRIRSGDILGPHFITSGPSLSGQSVRSPERGVEMVKEQKAAGYDFLKLHPGLTKATFPGIVQTAKSVGIPFAGHVSFNVGVWAAIESGYATIDHMDGFIEAITPGVDTMAASETGLFGAKIAYKADRSKIGSLVKALKANRIAVVPTEALAERWLSPEGVEVYENDPDLKYIDPKERERWLTVKRNYQNEPGFNKEHARALIRVRQELLRACQKEGVNLLLGSDGPQILNVPGFSIHHELKYLVDAGLTPYEALKTGTVNVAKFLGKEKSGAVRKGFDSDLVLLAGNPLENIENSRRIEAVIIGTSLLSREFMDSELEKIATSHKQ